jgi:hypothetical protein
MCGALDPSNQRPVALVRGEMGYFIWMESMTPEEWNRKHNISSKQAKAMLACSVLGWPMNPSSPASPKK